jgi:SAM-dependent methyltransferase
MVRIVEDYMTPIRRGARVLDVGCWDWARIRDRCREVGAHYEGIDVAPDSSVATCIASLADLSFEDESFDLVLDTQSLEHWSEHGCSLRRGLHQSFRVTKPPRNVSSQYAYPFSTERPSLCIGRLGKLTELMYACSKSVDLEAWGRPPAPYPQVPPLPRIPETGQASGVRAGHPRWSGQASRIDAPQLGFARPCGSADAVSDLVQPLSRAQEGQRDAGSRVATRMMVGASLAVVHFPFGLTPSPWRSARRGRGFVFSSLGCVQLPHRKSMGPFDAANALHEWGFGTSLD